MIYDISISALNTADHIENIAQAAAKLGAKLGQEWVHVESTLSEAHHIQCNAANNSGE